MKEYWNKFLRPLLPFIGIGIVICAIAVVWILYMQRGAHMELRGSIQKLRTLPLDESSVAAIADFRLENPADYKFVVRQILVTAVMADGKVLEGSAVSEVDTKNVFQYFAQQLGPMYNPVLLMHAVVQPHQTVDRMIAARFEVPEKVFAQRKDLRIRIEEIDGPVAELSEHPSR